MICFVAFVAIVSAQLSLDQHSALLLFYDAVGAGRKSKEKRSVLFFLFESFFFFLFLQRATRRVVLVLRHLNHAWGL
jgi:hypothetical protein